MTKRKRKMTKAVQWPEPHRLDTFKCAANLLALTPAPANIAAALINAYIAGYGDAKREAVT